MEKSLYVFESEFGPIYIESKSLPEEFEGKTPVSIIEDADFIEANKSFEDAMSNVEVMYKSMFNVLKKLSPNEFNIEVGIKFNVKTGFFVFSAGSEVDFKISLKWNSADIKEVTQ